MFDRGYLSAGQMAGAFELLRSNDLFWSRLVREYLMGERRPMSDLMAWNADATRMPYRMHSEYLRRLYLQDDLAEGRYRVGGKPIALTDIRVPVFCVGTASDHVAPWRSVYKLHLLTESEITFVLAGGGHNTGIVSEPGGRNRGYRVMTRPHQGKYVDPDAYLAQATPKEGSWWPEWHAWLASRSADPVPASAVWRAGKRIRPARRRARHLRAREVAGSAVPTRPGRRGHAASRATARGAPRSPSTMPIRVSLIGPMPTKPRMFRSRLLRLCARKNQR